MSQNQPKWRVRAPRAGEAAGVEVYDGDQCVCQMSHHPAYRAQSAEYARRIVACVNACEGIDTESLEADGYGDNWAEIAQHRVDLMDQRDELLAAFEKMHSVFTSGTRLEHCEAALKECAAVFARAKGGAA